MIQRIYRIGAKGSFVYHRKGVDILRMARLNEIVPEKEAYYMHPPNDNTFFLMSIPKETPYAEIKSLVKSGYIWIKNKNNVG
jgi:hypothetical protein